MYNAGEFSDTCFFGGTEIISKGGSDFYISKFDKEGALIWIKQFGSSGYDRCSDIIHHKGHLYATGFFNDTLYFADTMLISSGYDDMFLLDMDVNGNINMIKKFGGTGEDQGYALCTDSEDNLYWTGIFQDTLMIDGSEIVSQGDFDLFTAKLNSEGEVLWINTAGGTEQDMGLALTTDKYNNVYVTGSFEDTATFADTTISSMGNQDIFLVKYNNSGEQMWLESAGGEWGAQASAITINNDDQLFLTGIFGGEAFFGQDTLVANGSFDFFVGAWDFNGEINWLKSFGSTERESAGDLAFDNDYLYLSCQFADETQLPDTTISDRSAQIMQFTKSGELSDLIQVGEYYRNKIALDQSSALYITGEIAGGPTPQLFGDTLLMATPFGGDVFITRISYNHTGTEELTNHESLQIFPNPADHIVNIIYDHEAVIKLYNLNGQLVHQTFLPGASGKASFDIHSLKSGIYMLTLLSDKSILSTKLIKQ